MDAVVFIGLVVVAITQMVKMAVPQIQGWVTIIVALAVSLIISLVDGLIGVADITIAQAFVAWFEAVGLAALAGKAGGGTSGDNTAQPATKLR